MSEQNDDELNTDPDENRILAAAIAASLADVLGKLLEVAVGLGKWILTSLLAINGAAAVAMWQSSAQPSVKLSACGIFVAGMIAALACGAAQLRQISRLTKPLGESIGYWISVQADGLRASSLEDTSKMEALAKQTRWMWASGLLSLLLFIGGVTVAGVGILNEPPAPFALEKVANEKLPGKPAEDRAGP